MWNKQHFQLPPVKCLGSEGHFISGSIDQIPQSQHPRSEFKKKKEEQDKNCCRKGRVRIKRWEERVPRR